jgi:AraC-like DNA-binding protein/mannose-6-phosphate isomerase-like protein (cupin superfamily)
MQNQKLLYAGTVATRTPWYMAGHCHDYHEMIVLVEGELNLIIDGEKIMATAGDALFYPAGSRHAESSCPDAPFRTYFIGFTDPAMADAGLPVRVVDRAGRMRQLAHWIYDEQASRQPDKMEKDAAADNAFLAALIAEFRRLTRDDTPPLVRDIRAYISRHLAGPITVDDLAAQAGMSKFHFIRTYRKCAGCTPMAAVRRLRAEAARNLALNTDLPLKQIAEHCGLSNPQHLSRIFREHFGAPPGTSRGHM